METRLIRSRNDKMIAGVCGGIARSLNIDPTVVRLVFLLTVFLGGISPLIYVVLWMVMPEEASMAFATPQPLLAQDPTGEWKYDPYTGQRLKP